MVSSRHPIAPFRAGAGERAAAGVLSAGLVAAIVWALVVGLGVEVRRAAEAALVAFDILPPPPPVRERVAPPPVRPARPEGRAAPPNIRSDPTDVVAPVPVVPVVVPPLITVAPVARTGVDPTAGAADRVGPGQGAGGEGDGFGGGGEGDGDGGGLGGAETPPRPKSGRLSIAVLPQYLRERNGEYSVELRYFVEADGRATACRAARSSGWPELDVNACRGVERRFRYRPALDGRGRPVRSVVIGVHSWLVEGEPDAPARR